MKVKWECRGCNQEIPENEVRILADASYAEAPQDIYGHGVSIKGRWAVCYPVEKVKHHE